MATLAEQLDARSCTRAFASKAHTLALLIAAPPLSARVPDLMYFSSREWHEDRRRVFKRIRDRFGHVLLAVRSSARDEDQAGATRAGHYRSFLDVPASDRDALERAIASVFAQYDSHPGNVVLVQRMVERAQAFGVVTTRCVTHGGPYYAISLNVSGRPDAVTGGGGTSTTTIVHREAWRDCVEAELRPLLAAADELEARFGVALEIEFALDADRLPLILQVRPLATARFAAVDDRLPLAVLADAIDRANRPRPGLHGARTILGNMPDWNPVEAIGARPRPLALSLYDRLITARAWRRARARIGYRELPGERLLVELAGRPYVDVRASFNSLLPQGTDEAAGTALVDAWLDRLARMPWLHDKVEFEVLPTCLEFGFEATFSERYGRLLADDALGGFRARLRDLTRRSLGGTSRGGLVEATSALRRLARSQSALGVGPEPPAIANLPRLLEECETLGTLPFACVARHAFIGEALLRSAVRLGALAPERASELRHGVRTIPSALAVDRDRVRDGSLSEARFIARYGHLRPGTYDIRCARYRDTPRRLHSGGKVRNGTFEDRFALSTKESDALDRLLLENGLDVVDAVGLVRYIGRATRLRERAKFVFTRHVSAIIEAVAAWGEANRLDREQLSYLTVDDLLAIPECAPREQHAVALATIHERRSTFHATDALELGSLICAPNDVYCFTQVAAVPNFVGRGRVRAPIARLDEGVPDIVVGGRIVCVQSADPGFEWIFEHGAAGLVTQYGGAHSHMAVRCAEVGLPAALGCGESLYRALCTVDELLLDCEARIVVPIGKGRAA